MGIRTEDAACNLRGDVVILSLLAIVILVYSGLILSGKAQHSYSLIISIFKEDNVFSMIASLRYGPPVNTDIDYYRTFFRLLLFCECCIVSCAIFVRRREASACLIILSTKQCSHSYHF